MNIQRGLVKDLGYEDTECTYVTGSDGVQYYFVNGSMLTDELHIVTPNVKEAVGHEVYSTLGVLDENANLIIPCVNKRIELLADRFILVEKNEIEGSLVKESLAVKDDPNQAGKYNNDSLNIKRAMENQMGSEGRFIFDDMFSEANLYDFSGRKVLGEDSTGFSFIGQVGKDLYLHTLDINDSIKAIKTPVEEDVPDEPIAPTTDVVPETALAPDTSTPEEEKQEEPVAQPTPMEQESLVTPGPMAVNTPAEEVQPVDATIEQSAPEVSEESVTVTPEVNTSDVSTSIDSTNVDSTNIFDNSVNPTPEVVAKEVGSEAVLSKTIEDVKSDTEKEVENTSYTSDYMDSSRYDKYIPSAHEKPNVKNAVYDEAVEVIRGLLNKTKDLETDVESKGVRIKELELDNKDFAKTIKEQKERIESLEKEKEQHVIEIRRQKKNIETLEIEKKDFLRTIEAQSKKLEEQDKRLQTQDEQLTQHESGKEELMKLLENATEVLN